MSAAYLPAPGEKYGPCADVCTHIDCGQNRLLALQSCRLCSKPIGAPTYFYNDDDGKEGAIVHATCLETHYARARA